MPRFQVTERNKSVNHNVWLMEFTRENLSKLWDKAKEHRILFDDDINGDFHKFCEMFFYQDGDNITGRGIVYIMDDFVGMVFISEITRSECAVHFSFFDGFLRDEVSMQMLEFIFNEYGFERINTRVVPFASKRVFAFIESLGFKWEGKKRKAMLYKGGKFDLILYGLLREEFFDLLERSQEEQDKWATMKEPLVEVQLKV